MRWLKYWLPTLLWMLIIFLFSSRPALHASTVNWLDFGLKKTAHYVEYYILFILMAYSFIHTFSFSRKLILLIVLIITILYATSDEYHQSLVPGREPRIRDVLIDSWGAMVALATIALIRPSDTTG